jgi:hypothetical protein
MPPGMQQHARQMIDKTSGSVVLTSPPGGIPP